MELASLVSGEPWSDHPACVHPVLAAVARGVNDAVTEAGRARLAALVPVMIGTAARDTPGDRRAHLDRAAHMALRCAAAALAQTAALGPEMESARRTALAVLARRPVPAGGTTPPGGTTTHTGTPPGGTTTPGPGGPRGGLASRLGVALLDRADLLDRFYPGTAARHVAQAVALLRAPGCDRALIRLLEDCIADCSDSHLSRQ